MYLSEAAIVFPAISINEATGFFREVDQLEITGMHEGSLKLGIWRREEICDSAGRRFSVVGVRVLGRLGPAWKWWLPTWLFKHVYNVDLELKELPPQPFEQILTRVVEMEQEHAWEMESTPEHPDFIAYLHPLRSCRSIADLVAFDRRLSGLPETAPSV